MEFAGQSGKEGGRLPRRTASLSSQRKRVRNLRVYSLKTKTRVWPAKRTSITCPVAAITTES